MYVSTEDQFTFFVSQKIEQHYELLKKVSVRLELNFLGTRAFWEMFFVVFTEKLGQFLL